MALREYNYDSIADMLLDYAKKLIIKNNTRAEENETTESLKNARRYIMAAENKDSYESHKDWTREELLESGVPIDLISKILNGDIEVPNEYRDYLLSIKRRNIIDSYEEMNNYYRMLDGLPNYGEEDIMTSYGKTITRLDDEELFRLQQKELIEIKKMYPKAEYLDHLGNRRVDPYSARKANNYDILNYKRYILEEEQALKFNSLYYENKRFVVMTNYSKAFSNMYYYDAFITLLIVFMTLQRFINEQYNYAIRKDFYNMDDIKNTFLSYGLPFFNDIPLKYQRNIVRNLNNLLKYKGTDKVLIDIVKLFGFSNVELYKYYLIKDFKRDEFDEPIIDLDNPINSYELKFAQVPFNSTDLTEALQNNLLYQTYEEVTDEDPYWGYGDDELNKQQFKEELLDMEFNYISTKYLAMNTIYDVTKNMMDVCYFFNLLDTLNENDQISTLTFVSKDLKSSANEILLFDAMTALYFLICRKFGFKDNIIKSSTGIASIYAFKFNQETNDLLNNIEENANVDFYGDIVRFKDYKLRDEDLQDMTLTKKRYTRDELIELYFRNNDYRNFLIDRMDKTEDYLEYKALNEIYRFNMLADSTINSYGDYKTYGEYLKANDSELYNFIDENSKNSNSINTTINTVIHAIEGFINSYKFDDLFSSLSSLTGDVVKSYIIRIINIFKAYTVELKKLNIYYVFDEKVSNRLRMFSVLLKNVNVEFADSLDDYLELIHFINTKEVNENSKLKEKYIWTTLLDLMEIEDIDDTISKFLMNDLKDKFNIDLFLSDGINLGYDDLEMEVIKNT